MEREIQIGDLVRIAPRPAVVDKEGLKQVGLVVGFAKTMQSGWTEPGTTEAKIEWTGGTFTVTALSMLELVG